MTPAGDGPATASPAPSTSSTAPAASTFSLRQVQSLLGLSRTVVAGLIAEGFVAPVRGRRNEWRFTFQDLALLRTAHALQASKIAPRRILRSLAKLKATLPAELPLAGLRISAIGAEVAVRHRDGHWQADSGQLLLDFEVAPVSGSVAILDRAEAAGGDRAPPAAKQRAAAAWFARGETLEAADPAGAEAAYRQALALAPGFAPAVLNLGAMLSDAGRFSEVLALSERALAGCTGSSGGESTAASRAPATSAHELALIHFNLGVALDHLERVADAIASYEQCLALDPALADAHYNLGRLRELAGDARGALRHFSAYRRLLR